MEMQLDSLLEKIKKDGVEEAEKKARDIISRTEQKSSHIITHAEEEKKRILSEAENEAARIKRQAEDSIRNALRDAQISLKQKLTEIFDAIIKTRVNEQFSDDILKEMLLKLVDNFKKDKITDLDILISKNDEQKMRDFVVNSFSEEIRKGITVKPSPSIEAGFRIGKKGENFYYDLTDEAVAELLKNYLNPKFSEFLNKGFQNAK